MQKLTFDDLYFVRMKFEKSIKLPKAPPKTPKKQLNPFLAIIQAQKPFFPQKSEKQQKQKPTQYSIDTWLAAKQVNVKKEIKQQKFINQHFECQNSQSQKVRLKPKEKWEMLRLSKSPLKREQSQKIVENKISPSKVHQQISNIGQKATNVNFMRETKKSNSNSTENEEYETPYRQQSNFNLNQSFLLKSRQNKGMIKSKSGQKKSDKSYQIMRNRHKDPISITKSYSELKLSSHFTSSSYDRTIIFPHTSDDNPSHSTTQIKRYSQTKRMNQKTTYSSNNSLRMNPIYYDNIKGNRLIKRYENREVSPDERRDLKDKYSHLQKRLESILRAVKTERIGYE